MKTFMGISGALLLAASCGASAQSNWYDPHPGKISYSYIEGGYLRGKDLVDRSTGLSQDADGFDVGASFALGAPAFIFGDYRSMDSGEFSALVGGPPPTLQSGKIRFKTYDAGLGLRFPMATPWAMDLNTTAAWEGIRHDGEEGYSNSGDFDYHANGYQLGVKSRNMIADHLELDAGATYDHIQDLHQWTGHGTALIYLNPMFALLGNYDYNNDGHAWVAGVRFSF